ncbi:MAG TPA: DUF2846 domain-containing protein [Gammaproteobacteria bacterium]|jgi:hypothetical protein
MATGPQFQATVAAPEGQAVIYVFRPEQSYAKAVAPDLTVDGSKLGAIQNDGYLMAKVVPGLHTVDIPYNFWTWGDQCAPATLQANAGEIHYVQIDLSSERTFLILATAVTSYCTLREVTPDVALPLIKQTRLSQQ